MVSRMAGDMRYPSPPLPPDPSPSTGPKVQRFQEPYMDPQSTILPTRTESDMKRVDSTRSSVPGRDAAVLPAPQPIEDAVNNAFQQPTAPVQLDPESLKAVTEHVVSVLQRQGLIATQTSRNQPQQTRFPTPPLPPPSEPRSPTQESVDSISHPLTPPTPDPRREFGEDWYHPSSPEPPRSDTGRSDPGSHVSHASVESLGSAASRKSSVTPKPSRAESPEESRTSGAKHGKSREAATVDGGRRTLGRHHSKDPEPTYEGPSGSRVRQSRESSTTEETITTEDTTTLEKIWQPLFNHDGKPTERLGHFLRGLALHLIDDYDPKGSLVITPTKMLRFFTETKVSGEHYPWHVIFGCDQMTTTSLSTMYRKLLCQHHLVQRERHDLPSVPALTPHGFESFMTCLIQAHPDTEYERLQRAVMDMPICNATDKSERFPKELSRRLFPADSMIAAEQRLISSLNHEPYVIGDLKGISSMPPPPPRKESFIERDRQPYYHSPKASSAVDDDDLASPAVQIERERKPYTAKEGAGKVYNTEDSRPSYPPTNSQSGTRPPRSNSGVPPQATYSNSGSSEPMAVPLRRQHRGSVSQNVPPPTLNGGYPKPSRGRSSPPPPPRHPFTRSDPYDMANVPSQQFGSSFNPAQYNPVLGEPYEETWRRYRSRSRPERSSTGRSEQNNDDMGSNSGYSNQSRPVPIATNYDYGARSIPGRPQGPLGLPGSLAGSSAGLSAGQAVGSFPTRRPTGPGGGEDRRRSMYSVPNVGLGLGEYGGTDGYGSYASGTNGGYGGSGGHGQSQQYGSSAQH